MKLFKKKQKKEKPKVYFLGQEIEKDFITDIAVIRAYTSAIAEEEYAKFFNCPYDKIKFIFRNL